MLAIQIKKSCRVLPLSGKVKALGLIKKKKKAYAEFCRGSSNKDSWKNYNHSMCGKCLVKL